jgi:CP family cyanate transporter-like MFS transporter
VTRTARALLLVAVLLVGLNLRGAMAAVSPVLPQIRSDLSLSSPVAGLLTTLPVLCFAAVAPLAEWFGRRTGVERAIGVACLLIGAATLLRSLGGAGLLLTGTLLIGAAITVGNVLLPVVIKRHFAARAGTVTGVYTAALCGGAAATAALTAPLAGLVGWRWALAAWALLALAAVAVWQVAVGRFHGSVAGSAAMGPPDTSAHQGTAASPWRHPVAWAVAVYLGTQSVSYYSVTAWLPTLLVEELRLDLELAGLAMSTFQVLGIPGTLLIPALVGRRLGQGWLACLVAGGWAVMIAGLLLWPAAWPVWTVVGGFAQGAGISLAFTVLVLRSHDPAMARRLSGMSQLVGYTLGAAGPVVVGTLNQATGGWTAPLALLLAVTACMGIAGVVAGRPISIGSVAVSR